MAPWLAVTIVGVVMVAAVVVFMLIMLSAVKQLDEKIPVYQENLEQMEANATAWFAEKGIDISGLTGSGRHAQPGERYERGQGASVRHCRRDG